MARKIILGEKSPATQQFLQLISWTKSPMFIFNSTVKMTPRIAMEGGGKRNKKKQDKKPFGGVLTRSISRKE